MGRQNSFIVSVFLVSILTFSGILFAQRVIDLDKVWGDMRVLGDDTMDWSGLKVANGDINGDGFGDIIIGAFNAAPGERTGAGEVYVIFGSSNPPTSIDLDKESADITIYGNQQDSYCGRAVGSGDINGDGYDDIIIGAYSADPGDPPRADAGEAYVIYGSSFPSPPYTIDLSTTSAGITIYGDDAGDFCGWMALSGNVNGDAYDDIIIGAWAADASAGFDAGKTYVIFGSSSPSAELNLSTQSADITVYGDTADEHSGRAVASGDINNDGYDDIIIGASNASPGGRSYAGETHVVFGSSFSSPPYTRDLKTQPADITVYGRAEYDDSGCAVASGDINGDEYGDVIIGAEEADPGGRTGAGETYVIFGSSSPPSSVDLSTQSADITVCGDDASDHSGATVISSDLNDDGYYDLIIGAYWASPPAGSYAGKTFVIFGTDFPPSTIDLDSQPADITIYGNEWGEQSSGGLSSGDVNWDGFNDIIIGAPYASPTGGSQAGETYVIFGGGPLVTAHGLGGKSWIKEFDIFGYSIRSFKAFGGANSQGEVHLAVGEIDADGHDEIAAGQGEGGKSWLKFFEVDGSCISTFKAFGASNTNGELHLAIGNFDAETSDNEIAIAQGEGGQSWVKTFETDGTLITAFKAFGAANAQGEVHLAAGDLENADGIDEIVAGMGEGGSSVVKIFNYDGTVIRSFKAFEAADNPGGEVHLAVGNFDADADLEIAAATGYNGGNKVRLFDKDGTLFKQFLAFGSGGNPNGDVQIAAADIDNDGVWEIICGHGEGGSSMVKVFKADGTFIRSFKAFGGVNAQGEVHLGKSDY
ncbi:MAG: hypothetical protein OEZ30_07985 [Candidatus Aminicenantes bacterium]|nr:hypothetical protein [Candidatus Aminicenantes bacterium]